MQEIRFSSLGEPIPSRSGPIRRGRRHLRRYSFVTAITVSASWCPVYDSEPAAVTAVTPSGAAHSTRMPLCPAAKTRLPDSRNCAKATLDEPAFTTATCRDLGEGFTERTSHRTLPITAQFKQNCPTTGQMDQPRINNLATFPLGNQPVRYLDTVEVCSSSLHRPTIKSKIVLRNQK